MLDGITKQHAFRILTYVESELVSCNQLPPWADALLERLSDPPSWLCELAVLHDRAEVGRCLRDYVYSEPFEELPDPTDDHIACLFLRHERGELPWAAFLRFAGEWADPAGSLWDCEEFYTFLNELEDAEHSRHVEERQRKRFQKAYRDVLSEIRIAYGLFSACRRQRGRCPAE